MTKRKIAEFVLSTKHCQSHIKASVTTMTTCPVPHEDAAQICLVGVFLATNGFLVGEESKADLL